MELYQIRCFLALYQEASFTRAAKRCGVAQPSLSKAIRLLEEELGGQLFLRKRVVRLTPLGESVRSRFERIGEELEALRRETAARQWLEPPPGVLPRSAVTPRARVVSRKRVERRTQSEPSTSTLY